MWRIQNEGGRAVSENISVCLDRSAPANVEMLMEMFVVLTPSDHRGAEVEAAQRPGRAHLPHLSQAGVQTLVFVYNGLQLSSFRAFPCFSHQFEIQTEI